MSLIFLVMQNRVVLLNYEFLNLKYVQYIIVCYELDVGCLLGSFFVLCYKTFRICVLELSNYVYRGKTPCPM